MKKEVAEMEKGLDLNRMFHPRSVALIGVSTDFTKISGRPLRFFLECGYRGQLYPVNPKYREIAGVPCYESLSAVPGEVGLAVITLPAPAVPRALDECAAKGVRAVAIISSGFAEVGGDGVRLQEELHRIATQHGIAVCGPNCSGFVYVPEKVTATFSVGLDEGFPREGPAAFVSQSGALSSYLLAEGRDRGLGFSYWITTGNECVLSFTDYLEYVLEDPKVGFVMGYLEDARNGDAFQACARRALVLDKPLILIKVGRSEIGARASVSHTGSLVGTEEVYQAVFSRHGVLRAENLDEIFDLAMLAQCSRRPRGKRVQILTNSGAAGIMMADAGSDLGLEFPDLSATTKEDLQKVMPPFASLSNPLDLTAEIVARPGLLRGAAERIAADPNVDNLAIYLGFVPGAHQRLAQDIVEVARSTEKLVLVTWFPLPPAEAREILAEAGLPLFPEPTRGMRALGKMARYVTTREQVLSRPPAPPARDSGRGQRAREMLDRVREEGRSQLSEAEAKELLRAWGIPVPRGGLARTVLEARSLADTLGGPVVMKVSSPDLPHKTEAGVIRLGVRNPKEAEQMFAELLERARTWNAAARVQGVLVEEMIEGEVREVIVGARQDLRFGPVVTFGLGGIFVEAIRDFAVCPAPLMIEEAHDLIRRVRGWQILAGFRGRPAADLDVLARVLCEIGDLAWECRDQIAEIEINPLFVLASGGGVRAGDALAVLR